MLHLVFLLLALPGAVWAQGEEWIRANYTKYEFRVKMRDGKRLFTSVYAPKDNAQAYPIMLSRTPYSVSPYGADNYRESFRVSEKFAREGYIFAFQDVRGRYLSEGEYVNVRPQLTDKRTPQDVDESTDTWDTIDWLVKNVPHNNGRVGIWGISYPGFYAAVGAIDAHPALKAASPQAPVTDWFVGDDFHHNGALYLNHLMRFFAGFGRVRPEPAVKSAAAIDLPYVDSYQYYLKLGPLSSINEKVFKNEVPFWNEMIRHPDYDDFWQARDVRRHLKNMRPAMMTVGGWFDAEDLFGALRTYEAIGASSPRSRNLLVMGPWYHGGWARADGDRLGDIRFASKTGEFYREEIEFPFFDYYLKDKGELKHPNAWMFETGSNQWRRYDSWPPKQAKPKTFYLSGAGKLTLEPPAGDGFDEYISDPAHPVPFANSTQKQMTREHMTGDQRFAAARPDVLTYMTDELEEDLVVAGPITPSLSVSTTGTDSDWVVKLIDVYPDDYPDNDPNPADVRMGGYQQLVRGELFRGRYRNSFERPEAFEPGKPAKVEYVLPDTYHNFRRGHRVMVQIQSSWFPLVDRNPQKYVNIYQARTEDFQKATQRVYRSRTSPSTIRLLVLER